MLVIGRLEDGINIKDLTLLGPPIVTTPVDGEHTGDAKSEVVCIEKAVLLDGGSFVIESKKVKELLNVKVTYKRNVLRSIILIA